MNEIQEIMDLSNAYWKSAILFTAIKFNLFDNIQNDTAQDICERCGMELRTGKIFLNACAALGLLEKEKDIFSVSKKASCCLQSKSPVPLTDSIYYNIMNYETWGKLSDLLQTGQPIEQTHLGSNTRRTQTFVHSMHTKALSLAPIILQFISFDDTTSILDVGGCAGTYSYLARQKKDMKCLVFDLEPVIKEGRKIIHQLDQNIEFTPGDYKKDPFPTGFDCIFLFGMLHQETPETCRKIIKKAYDSLKKGRCYILDIMLNPDEKTPQFAALFSLNMALTHETGEVFTIDNLKEWCKDFDSITQIPLPEFMPYKLIELKKNAS